MAELTHLSYSSVSMYGLCPLAWRKKYVEKIPTIATPALVFGSCFHEALETIIKARAAGETNVPIADIWSSLWAERERGEEINWQGEAPEELSNLGLRMLAHKDTRALLDSIEPMLDLSADGSTVVPVIEKKVELRVPGVPVPIVGYIDMIGSDGALYDFKTAARMWTPEKAQEELQPAVYLAALSQAGYTQNPEMIFRHAVFTKTRTPQAQVFETRRTAVDLFRVMRLIREVWEAIQSGVFVPRLDGWKHSPKYCDYWDRCFYGGGR